MILSKQVEEYIKKTAKPKLFKEIKDYQIQERMMRSNLLYKGLQCIDINELRLIVQAELSNELFVSIEKENKENKMTFSLWKQQLSENGINYFMTTIDNKYQLIKLYSLRSLEKYKFIRMAGNFPHLELV